MQCIQHHIKCDVEWGAILLQTVTKTKGSCKKTKWIDKVISMWSTIEFHNKWIKCAWINPKQWVLNSLFEHTSSNISHSQQKLGQYEIGQNHVNQVKSWFYIWSSFPRRRIWRKGSLDTYRMEDNTLFLQTCSKILELSSIFAVNVVIMMECYRQIFLEIFFCLLRSLVPPTFKRGWLLSNMWPAPTNQGSTCKCKCLILHVQ